ncbi:RNA-splicing factor [Agyrium rufum]|nr:RNA-splicing factor [Agyrium rufum]
MEASEVATVSTEQTAPFLFKKRAPKKSNFRKRASPPPQDASDSSDYSSSADEEGRKVKRRKKAAGVTASSGNIVRRAGNDDLEPSKFSADRAAQIDITSDATKQSNWYEEASKKDDLSAEHLLGKSRARQKVNGDQATVPDGTYKGSANYSNFIQKNPNASSKQVGPVKAPTNIRTITVTDFTPDVCKDYKQTGFCGFGDNCKFLHAREDYKQGWQLDREWENVTKGKKLQGTTVASANRDAKNGDADDDEDEDAMLEGIPFACIICKEPYKNPIITRCGHYFCEYCALKRYRKTPTCAACGAGTNGSFNGARNLKKLLDKKRERARLVREKAIEDGEEVSEEEEEFGAGG